ncbi:MAG: hypothetical protein OXC95_07905 [Dehalococcoidia bacterium]|nr:hypothetical protein [Dehalococcoidia bacterium]
MQHHTDTVNSIQKMVIQISSSCAGLAKYRYVAMMLGVIALALVGCSSDPDVIGVRGRSIEIHAKRPVVAEKITYEAPGDQFYIFRPRASNRQMAAVCVTVVNRTSTVMPLEVNPDAARLGNRRGDRIPAFDPFEDSSIVDSADEASILTDPGDEEDLSRCTQLLWGQVQLDRNFQVSGWMLFDVPKGLTLGTLWWDEVDEVVLDYVEYRRR